MQYGEIAKHRSQQEVLGRTPSRKLRGMDLHQYQMIDIASLRAPPLFAQPVSACLALFTPCYRRYVAVASPTHSSSLFGNGRYPLIGLGPVLPLSQGLPTLDDLQRVTPMPMFE